MRRTFQKWLFAFVAAAFLVAFSLSFYIQTKQSQNNAVTLIQLKIDDAKQQIEINQKNVVAIRTNTDAAALSKARALASIIAVDPTRLEDKAWIEHLLKVLDIDQLHISDKNGILIISTSGNVGYDMASSNQSAAFMPAIRNPNFELVQDPLPRGVDNEVFQYAGVSRIDNPGIVQIGYYPTRLRDAMEVADIKNLSAGFRIGNNGKIIVIQNQTILSISDQKYIGKKIDEYGIPATALASNSILSLSIGDKKYFGVSNQYKEYTILGVLPQDEMYVNRNTQAIYLILFNLLIFGIIFALVSELVQRVVISGIQKINKSLELITSGNLEEQVEVTTNREFSSLSTGINSTVGALKNAIAAETARIDKEMEFAKTIQLSILPSIFPPYPDRTEFDIFAIMQTAREVGGDFYDFFLVDDNHLAFMIADVSGKGIPAAMFMMTSKTLIKSLAESGLTPAEIFSEANNRLFKNNQAGMFVTGWLGILEIDSGKLSFVNAGHNPPLIKRNGEPYEWLKFRSGIILAGMEDAHYRQFEIQMTPGDRIFLYTDGITEAGNNEGTFFSNQKLINNANQNESDDLDIHDFVSSILKEVDIFSTGIDQADDITMMMLEFRGDRKK